MSVIGTGASNTINVSNAAGQSIPNSTTISTAPGTRPQQFYDRTLLKVLRQTEFHWDQFAQKRQLPKNAGTNTINFRKLGKLNPALTPLTEGVTPNGDSASKTNVTATVSQYGSFMAFSDKVDFEEIDPIITEYTVEQGNQAKETLDIIVRDILANGTNVRRAGNRTATNLITSTDIFTLKDIRRVVRDFRKNFVKPVIGNDYACFIGPDTEFTLMDDPDFQKIMQYGMDNKPMLDNEIGRAFGVRFFVVNNPKILTGAGASGIDVHTAILIGSNAYGVVDVAGEGNVKSIVKGLGSAGTEDPLDQRQTIGWKINSFGAVRLEELAICRYEFAVNS